MVDAVLFDDAGWFALDAHNRRVPRVLVPSLEAGLGLIGKGPVASIVGRLRPGAVVVDIDLPGIDGHGAAEVISMWARRCGLWSLVRPSGGADGRAHVFVLAGDREDQLRERVTALRTRMAVSSPHLQVRTQVRPLSARHRKGVDTTPYAQPATVINELRMQMATRPLANRQGQPEAATVARRDHTFSTGRPKPAAVRSGPWPNPSSVARASAAQTRSANPRPSLLPSTAPSPSRPDLAGTCRRRGATT